MKVMTLILAMSIFSLSAYAKNNQFDPSRVFIKVKKGKSLPHSKFITKSKNLFNNVYLVHTTNLFKLEAELKKSSSIALVERNYFAGKKKLPSLEKNTPHYKSLTRSKVFNDPDARRIWAFKDAKKHGISVNKSYLSPLNVQKEEIVVAVVDTGVDYNHEDLKANMWINQNEIPNNNIDDDNNGYIDDVHGINTIVKDSAGNSSGNPMASHAHGTHVSGTIAAVQNNSIGIAGIAQKVKIMAIRAVPDSSDETDADVVESFLYAAKHGAKLINCSFGKNHNEGGTIVNETITHIGETYGVLTFAASGNDYRRNIDTNPKYPASFDSDYLFTVASTTKRGSLSWFSNVGKISVDIAAPGSSVYSTTPNNSYGTMSGTSMATPTTVGVAAEVLSHFPNLGPKELKKVLMDSVTKVDRFDKITVSAGRVDLYNALQTALKIK